MRFFFVTLCVSQRRRDSCFILNGRDSHRKIDRNRAVKYLLGHCIYDHHAVGISWICAHSTIGLWIFLFCFYDSQIETSMPFGLLKLRKKPLFSAFNYDCILKSTFVTFALAFHSGGTEQIFSQGIEYSFPLEDHISDIQFYCCTCFYFLP